MTEPDDTASATRPISVAELLARNGTIGSPPVGGRRRRRRGNSDAVTVAELTGEIPIVTDEDFDQTVRGDAAAPAELDPDELDRDVPDAGDGGSAPVNGTVLGGLAFPVVRPDQVDQVDVEAPAESAAGTGFAADASGRLAADAPAAEADSTVDTSFAPAPDPAVASEPGLLTDPAANADYDAHLRRRDADDAPVAFAAPRRPRAFNPLRPAPAAPPATDEPSSAEQMSPDPAVDDELVDLGPDVDLAAALDEHAADAPGDHPGGPLRTGTLFGGRAGDGTSGALTDGADSGADSDQDEDGDDHDPAAESTPLVRGFWVVAQCVLAVAFGAGLFIAFDQLWRWSTLVALVLSVLVILGLVVGVRVVRKSEDIGSTLIAVAVGALVTLGPLALLQSH